MPPGVFASGPKACGGNYPEGIFTVKKWAPVKTQSTETKRKLIPFRDK